MGASDQYGTVLETCGDGLSEISWTFPSIVCFSVYLVSQKSPTFRLAISSLSLFWFSSLIAISRRRLHFGEYLKKIPNCEMVSSIARASVTLQLLQSARFKSWLEQ